MNINRLPQTALDDKSGAVSRIVKNASDYLFDADSGVLLLAEVWFPDRSWDRPKATEIVFTAAPEAELYQMAGDACDASSSISEMLSVGVISVT